MPKVFFLHKNKYFLEFIQKYLSRHGFEVETSTEGVSVYNMTIKSIPDLIIASKNTNNFDLNSFLFKRRVVPQIKNIPVFLIGEFSPKELSELKSQNIEDFLSNEINPILLLDKIKTTLNIPDFTVDKKTPMLYDLNVNRRIFIIQLEGNFEPDKLDLINYKIRTHCLKNGINSPRLFYIIPSMYDDTITKENIDIMFDILHYKELKIKPNQIKILTKVQKIKDIIENDPDYSMFRFVDSFQTGFEKLSLDFENTKRLPLNYMKPGFKLVIDLYDEEGDIRVPANTVVTEDMLNYFRNTNLKYLIYYSDKDLEELINQKNDNVIYKDEFGIVSDYFENTKELHQEVIQSSSFIEKMHLFYNKLKDKFVLIVAENRELSGTIRNFLEGYLKTYIVGKDEDIIVIIKNYQPLVVFLDDNMENQRSFKILQEIRNNWSKKDLTVVVNTNRIDAKRVMLYKKIGTDCIIVPPYSKMKLLQKIFEFVSLDRAKK